MHVFPCLFLMILPWPGFLDLVWASYCIKPIIASWFCIIHCSSVCRCVWCRVPIHTCGSYLSPVTEMFLPRWLRAAVWPRTVVPLCAKAEARIRDGGEAYRGPLLYLDWQMNSSFAQALFTKGSHPHLWERCL